MPKSIEDILRELSKTNKEISNVDSKLSKNIDDIKKVLKSLEKKIDLVVEKIQEFEIIMDAADIIEEHMEEEENRYNTEWNPYEDENYSAEDFDNYDNEDDD